MSTTKSGERLLALVALLADFITQPVVLADILLTHLAYPLDQVLQATFVIDERRRRWLIYVGRWLLGEGGIACRVDGGQRFPIGSRTRNTTL